MYYISTVENQPCIPKIKAVLYNVRLSFRLVPFKHQHITL